MRPHSIGPICGLVLAFLPAAAPAATDSQLWTTVSATEKLGGPWRAQEEFVGRFSDNRSGLYELEVVGLVGYKPTNNLTFAAGYVHNPLFSHGDLKDTERRAREQVTIDNLARIGPATLSARFRMEQRWRDQVAGTGWRARPYLRLSLPFAGKTSLILSSEPFVNLNTTAFQNQAGLDRIRNVVAVGTPLSKTMSIEAGYMNQHGFVRGGPDTSDHVASLVWSLNF